MSCKADLNTSTILAASSAKMLLPLLISIGAFSSSTASAQLVPDTCLALPGDLVNCTDVAGAVSAEGVVNSGTTILTGPGIVASSADDIILNVAGNVTTTEDGQAAVLLRAADEVIFTADGIITTLGNNADGVNIEGSGVTADLNVVRTSGIDSDGVGIYALGGDIGLDADLVETNGDLSSGTILRGTGDIDLTARAVRTGGTDAVAIDIQSDAAACILLGLGGCDVTAAVDEVTTEGFGGIGALVAAAGDTNINLGVLRTGGDEAAGLDLSADATACVILGIGACDTAFTVGSLTTEGDRSPGAIVRAVGDIDANVGVLRTNGDEAIGLDLGSDPDACVILGAGACDTSFSVGELTTSGAGATGILVRAAGQTTGDVGILSTQGQDAAGVDILADPQACILLGAGACDVNLTAEQVTTQGGGAAAVILQTVGNVTVDLGLLTTDGNDAAGLQIALNPALCLVLGPGSCVVNASADNVDTDGDNSPGIDIVGGGDPVIVDAGTVQTDGDNSDGIFVENTGPVTVTADNVETNGGNSAGIEVDGGEGAILVDSGVVSTSGDNSPGIDVDGTGIITVEADVVSTRGGASAGILINGADDPVTVTCGTVTTTGANSPGVDVTGEGEIAVRCDLITTAGVDSDAVQIDGGDGNVLVDVTTIRTTGADSDGINVMTDAGDTTILAGLINVRGLGSDGINVMSSECGDINITARGPITAAEGTGILANTACAVSVTTLQGAPVAGQLAGIDVTSGTGATILIGDSLTSAAGPALNVDGAAAQVTIGGTGSITGRINLTDNNDVFINNGLFRPVGTSEFGGGFDTVANYGTISVAGAAVLAGCESFTNRGLITMVNGAATDRLTLCGNFAGEAGSRLAIDVASSAVGTPTDQLFIGGNAAGNTQVTLNLLGGPGVINATGALVVDAATATGTPFTLAGPVRSGFVDYALVQRASDTFLVALPNDFALQPVLLTGMGLDFWYQSADAWSESAALRRNNLGSDGVRPISFWAQGYGSNEKRDGTRDFEVFGSSRELDTSFETDRRGAQGGVDFALRSGEMAFGLTGGYQRANSDLNLGTAVDLEGHNLGAYMLYGGQAGPYAELLAKADFFDARFTNGNLFNPGEIDGKSYGAEGEVGYRLNMGGVHLDFGAGLAYVRTTLDDLEGSNFTFDFDRGESLRGRLGARAAGTGNIAPYVDLKVFHEFMGDHDLTVRSGGFTYDLSDRRKGTWLKGELGLTGSANGSGGFASAWIERGDVKGYGVRLGFRF